MKEYTVRVYEHGTKAWCLDGKRHREDGPAIEWSNGDKEWYLDDKLHREDGPAIEWSDGTKAWYVNGRRHREDGPAVEWADGDKDWYLHGQEVTEEEHKRRTAGVDDARLIAAAPELLEALEMMLEMSEMGGFGKAAAEDVARAAIARAKG